jgi:hypothetical protein
MTNVISKIYPITTLTPFLFFLLIIPLFIMIN